MRPNSVRVMLRRDSRTGNVIVLAPNYPKIDGKSLDLVWEEGWRPRKYDQGHVILVQSCRQDDVLK